MPRRSLTLRRETLTELTSDDLAVVVGGVPMSGLTCPALDCFSGAVCNLTYQPRCF
jgi:hypothetical protein